jgi:hypothetical protein
MPETKPLIDALADVPPAANPTAGLINRPLPPADPLGIAHRGFINNSPGGG